jgi:hypothetical protein
MSYDVVVTSPATGVGRSQGAVNFAARAVDQFARKAGMEIDPDNAPTVDEKPLTPYEHQVKAHWEQCYESAAEQIRAAGGEAALDQAVRNATHRADAMAARKAETRLLIAQLKWRHADPGTAGVPNREFLARRPDLTERPPFDAVKALRDGAPVPAAIFPAPPLPDGRKVGDAQWAKIDAEMDAAFVRNVAKNRRIQDERRQARQKQTPPANSPVLGSLGLKLKRHWETYLPKMTAELRSAGTLESRLHETEQQMLEQEATMIQQGMSPDQARETTREIGFLPAEPTRGATTSPTPSTPAAADWDAVHKKIAQEMDSAFVRNVAKNRAIQAENKAARVSADVLTRIDRAMDEAFVKNVARNRQIQADQKAGRQKE